MEFLETIRIKGIQIAISESAESSSKQKVSDLAFAASKKLLNQIGWKNEEVGILLFGTSSSDYLIPSTASLIFKRLGLTFDCLSFDISGNIAEAINMTGKLLKMMPEDKKAILIMGESYQEEEQKLVAAYAVERSGDGYIQGGSIFYPDTYEKISQRHKGWEPVESGEEDIDYSAILRKYTEIDFSHYSNLYFMTNSNQLRKMNHYGVDISEKIKYNQHWKYNGALTGYLAVKNHCGDYLSVMVNPGIVVGYIVFSITKETYTNILYTKEYYNDLKED